MLIANFSFGQEAREKYQMVDRAHEYNLNPPPPEILVPLNEIASYGGEKSNLLYSNGPFITGEGVGFNGADISLLQSNTLGMSSIGIGVQFADGRRIADDFIVDSYWAVESIKLFGYQSITTFTGNSTFTGAYLQIWDGSPDDPDSSVIWGDLITNRMASTSFTNIFRVTENTGPTDNDRAIMDIICDTPGLVLGPGTYWIDFSLDGSATSGPWHPPITILGQTTTGNALQFTQDDWIPIKDSGTNTPQGATFEIYGLSIPVLNVNTGETYNTIQEAIDQASPGNIIKISGGTYSEDVDDYVGVTFSPGTSPGCVTIAGNFTVTPTTTFDMDIFGDDLCDDYDQIAVTGDLDITDATLNIILDGYIPAPGSEFVIFTYGGTLTGEFDDILIDNPDVEFTISYGDGTDDVIVLTASGDPPAIPLANWALYLGFTLVVVVVAIRFRGSAL